MECFWRLFSHWQPDGHCYQQNPAVFYLHFPAHHGLPDYPLPGIGFLAESPEIYLGGKAESLVLFVSEWSMVNGQWSKAMVKR